MNKQQYYFTFFDAYLTNMKKTWEGINNIIVPKSTNAQPINLIKNSNVGNIVVSDPIVISNVFNRHLICFRRS